MDNEVKSPVFHLSVAETAAARERVWVAVEEQRQQSTERQKMPDAAQSAQQKDVYNTMFWDVAH
ncbi:MAG: hypothetical protein WA082_03650 [Candidatus Moraniibacteriota bacterium]